MRTEKVLTKLLPLENQKPKLLLVGRNFGKREEVPVPGRILRGRWRCVWVFSRGVRRHVVTTGGGGMQSGTLGECPWRHAVDRRE